MDDDVSYPQEFMPFDILLFHTIKHKENNLLITAVTASNPLSYVGTYDGKLLVYEYNVVEVSRMREL